MRRPATGPRSNRLSLARRLVLIEVSRFDAGGEQRVTLQVERLAAPQTSEYVTTRATRPAASQDVT
jgi:hypothetical protein